MSSPRHNDPPDGSSPSGNGDVRHLLAADGDDSAVRLNGPSTLLGNLKKKLLSAIPQDRLASLSEEQLRSELTRLIDELVAGNTGLSDLADPETLIEQILGETHGYGPIHSLMRDHDISEILINGPRQVFIERRGQLQATDITFRDENHLGELIHRMTAGTTRRWDEKSPILDARLPDGSRLNVVGKPPALNGPLVSIRRFGIRPLTVEDLLANDSITKEMLDFLSACVKARMSIIISGGSGSGKTTLLNALSRFISNSERIITIEDTAELELQQSHVAKIETQRADQNGREGVSMRDLAKNSLRMRPDRIIIGECRAAEAMDMLQAMNTGHEGSMTTVHANTTREALSRIEFMVNLSGTDVTELAVRKLIAASVSLIVQVARLAGGKRKVVAISEIVGMEGDIVSMHDIFEFVQTGIDKDNVAGGYFRTTGNRPYLLKRLAARGFALPVELFREGRLQNPNNREAGR
jgi:pilus assembly protein CpaF